MAGKPNPLLSRHKKHRGADLTVTFHCCILTPPVTQSANLRSTDQIDSDNEEHEVCKALEYLEHVYLSPAKASQLFWFWLCPSPENINSVGLKPLHYDRSKESGDESLYLFPLHVLTFWN